MRRIALAPLLLAIALAAGCTVRLAPPYDPSLVSGLTEANAEALAIFSAVSDGSAPAAFPALAPAYDAAIGRFEALGLRAEAREVPPLAERLTSVLARSDVLAEACAGEDATGCVNASPRAIETIVGNLAEMRRTHATAGIAPDTAQLFKTAHVASIDQALTVETALKRE